MESNNEEVIEIMMDNPKVITKILYVQEEYKQTVISTVLKKSFEDFASDNGLDISVEPGFWSGEKHARLSFSKKEWNNATIIIQPENKQSNYWIGIWHRARDSRLKTELHTLSMMTDGTNEKIPFGSKWLPGKYRWLYDAKTIEDIILGQFMKVVGELIINIIREAETIPGFAEL